MTEHSVDTYFRSGKVHVHGESDTRHVDHKSGDYNQFEEQCIGGGTYSLVYRRTNGSVRKFYAFQQMRDNDEKTTTSSRLAQKQ